MEVRGGIIQMNNLEILLITVITYQYSHNIISHQAVIMPDRKWIQATAKTNILETDGPVRQKSDKRLPVSR